MRKFLLCMVLINDFGISISYEITRVFSGLSLEQSADYDTIKKMLLLIAR